MPELPGEPGQERHLDPAAARRQRHDERGREHRQGAEHHGREPRPRRRADGQRREDERAGDEAHGGQQRVQRHHPPRRPSHVGERHPPLPPHAVAEGPGFDVPLHGVDHDQHGEDDELDEHEVGREVVT